MTSASPTRSAVLSLLAALVAAVAAGCGASKAPPSDPAGVVPARAPVYVEATIPPEGATRDDALAAAGKILGTSDPAARLRRLVRGKGARGDVAPWLGDRVGAFSLGGSTDDGAIVAVASDTGAARSWVARQGSRTQRYRDVDVRLDAGDRAYALVEDRVVVGAPAAVRASVDAASGDDLASYEGFTKAIARVDGGDGIGRGYLAPRALVESRTGSAPPASGMAGSLAMGLLTGSLPTAVGMRFHADGTAVRADTAAIGGAKPGAPPDPDVLAALTGRAWLAAGVGPVGPRLREQLGGSGAILGLVGARAGLDIERDLLDWMGEGAAFVTGASPATIGGALVVRSSDPAATRAAVPRLASLLTRFARGATSRELHAPGVDAGVSIRAQGIPAPVQIAAAGDRFVIAVGQGALREAIAPSSRLGDQADFRAAAATLGQGLRPSAYVGARALTPLATVLAARTGGDVRQVRATLGRFTALVAADRGDGRWRASLGLR